MALIDLFQGEIENLEKRKSQLRKRLVLLLSDCEVDPQMRQSKDLDEHNEFKKMVLENNGRPDFWDQVIPELQAEYRAWLEDYRIRLEGVISRKGERMGELEIIRRGYATIAGNELLKFLDRYSEYFTPVELKVLSNALKILHNRIG